MRQISIEDLHRLILMQAADPDSLDPWKSNIHHIHGRLKLKISDDVENRIVSSLLGSLTYRNREQIRRLLNRLAEWPADGNTRELDIPTYWAGIGKKYFDFVDTFYIKPDLFEMWRRQMHSSDEDLPAIALLCTGNSEYTGDRALTSLNFLERWPTFIRGNDPQFYRELLKGYGCLHLHLSGAYPAPYFWLGLMNSRFDEDLLKRSEENALRGYRTAEDLDRIVKLIKLARKARRKLLKYVSGRTTEDVLNRKLDDCRFLDSEDEDSPVNLSHFTDIAQQDMQNWHASVCPSLIGERYLNLRVLRAILVASDERLAEHLARIYWAYVVAKNAFLSTVQHAEGIAGFDYFEHTFRMISWRTKDQEDRCAQEIGSFLQEAGSLVKLELMIAPRNNASDYGDDIKIATIIQNRLEVRQARSVRDRCGAPRVGLIVHFIKDHGEPLERRITGDKSAYRAYHSAVRDRVTEQFEQLAKHLNEHAEAGVGICGIDAANRELYCPPEVFGDAFRRATPELRRRSGGLIRSIGRTFHVGEDFTHLATGLRRIYEALVFLDLRPGDRLGHACALGLDPARWVLTNPAVEMHLIDILDDAVFELLLLRDYHGKLGQVDERRVSELTRTIDECCVDIFGTTIPFVQLEKAWRMRATAKKLGGEKFNSDSSIPRWIKIQHERSKSVEYMQAASHSLTPQVREICGPDDDVPRDVSERVALEYQYDIRTIRRFLQIRTIDTTHAVEHLAKLQSAVASEINQRGIVVESNPSSNWLIGGLESHSETPAVRWLIGEREDSAKVAFTINPDDPTVFASSIENEYFMVFSSAVHSIRAMSRVECLRYISEIRERSLEASFLD